MEKKGEDINDLQKSLQILELDGRKIREKENELQKKDKVSIDLKLKIVNLPYNFFLKIKILDWFTSI